MPERLLLADADTARDVMTFVGRAARVAGDGVRLQASDGVLRVSAATLVPQSMLDATPTVFGMRIAACDPELVADLVVPGPSLAADSSDPRAIVLPETALMPSWAGMGAPRSGWEQIGQLDAHALGAIAAAGIAEVAAAVPTDAGEDAVRAVRAAVWGHLDEQLFGAPRGVAFTAEALGFLRDDEQVPVFRAARWTRLSTRRGHVISRGPARVGLTEVRTTGT